MRIAGRTIGTESPPFVVAEISGNHGGQLSRALELIDAAADAGVDAVKFRRTRRGTITIDADTAAFRISDGPRPSGGGRTLYDLYTEAHTPWNWHAKLFRTRAAGD